MKKYELTEETKLVSGVTLHRIRALVSFGTVQTGNLGGWIESEKNLSHSGNAWVSGDAMVSGNAWVLGDAWMHGNAQASGNARVSSSVQVSGNALVSGDAHVYSNTMVYGNAEIVKDTHYFVVGPIGSRDWFTTFFRTKDKKIFVSCGCFKGDIQEFEDAVKKTHGGTKHEKAYLAAIELAKLQIEDVSE